MKNSKKISTPKVSNILIDKDENGVDTEIIKCQGIIRSLIYLTIIITNIMFSVCMWAQFLTSSRESHFKIVKIIL